MKEIDDGGHVDAERSRPRPTESEERHSGEDDDGEDKFGDASQPTAGRQVVHSGENAGSGSVAVELVGVNIGLVAVMVGLFEPVAIDLIQKNLRGVAWLQNLDLDRPPAWRNRNSCE